MNTGAVGKVYQDGQVIIRQGEKGDCMYVILDGQVEIVTEKDGHEMRLAVRNAGDFFGEMAIFEREVRGVTRTICWAGFAKTPLWRFVC